MNRFKNNRKRANNTAFFSRPKKEKNLKKDVELDSDEDLYDDDSDADDTPKDDKFEVLDYTTPDQVRCAIAKQYLDAERELVETLSDSELPESTLNRLKDEELEKTGKLKRKIADDIKFDTDNIFNLKCKQQKLPITCIVVSYDSEHLFSASKDASIVKWSLKDKTKLCVLSRKSKKNADKLCHEVTINCLAISKDDKFLASGDEKGLIKIWNPKDLSSIHTFKAHKCSVNGLIICNESNYLYSSGSDSLIKVWTLNELSYVETLFGHQSKATSVDLLYKDRIVSSGGMDNTIRVWKIQEETQLVYNGYHGSIDMVKRLDDGHFVSCGDDGNICLWGLMKKKPLYTEKEAHGSTDGNPNWISCIAPLVNSNLILSGSCDGFIRSWKCADNYRSLTALQKIPVTGFVNSIVFTSNEKFLIAAVGKEHRLGRWNYIEGAKNYILCVPVI